MKNTKILSETINVMQSHVSVRKYSAEPIPKEHLVEILQSGQGAASSNFVQSYSIVHVTDKDKKDEIAELAQNKHISDVADFFLFCADLKRLEIAGKKRGIVIEHDNLENFMVAIIDTSLIAQNVITAAESLGYGGCYIGGVRNSPDSISKLVGLPDKVFPLFGLCLGAPTEKNEVKPRLPLDAIVHENQYDVGKYDGLLEEYDQTLKTYYQQRSSNNKQTTWTESMADFMKTKRRMHMREFVESKGFHLK
ncbi:oxygen-insensitive NADPH nitroreductase [Priestia megaterium]|uniref:oxygen-insensitive NADPH nitroreductase n=1 Tax=Priestia megaterium TaxID=1404 RepID=UPI00366FEE5C